MAEITQTSVFQQISIYGVQFTTSIYSCTDAIIRFAIHQYGSLWRRVAGYVKRQVKLVVAFRWTLVDIKGI